jgi:hypothetical protein
MVLNPGRNQHKLKYKSFVAAEQEFNTDTYGIKGNIDGTVMVEDQNGIEQLTALEIKTGKHKPPAYRGQVIIYSLLISERFKNSNSSNILLYINDANLNDAFEFIRTQKAELDQLIMGRNDIAKWQKLNNKNFDALAGSTLKRLDLAEKEFG